MAQDDVTPPATQEDTEAAKRARKNWAAINLTSARARAATVSDGGHNRPACSPTLDLKQSPPRVRVGVYVRRACILQRHDPYIKVLCEDQEQKSKIVLRSREPHWDELLTLEVADCQTAVLTIKVKHDGRLFSTLLGSVSIPIRDIEADPDKYRKLQWYDLQQSRPPLLGQQRSAIEMQVYYTKGFEPEQLDVLTATWNVGNNRPAGDLAKWLKGCGEGSAAKYHMIAVGAQECEYKVSTGKRRRLSNKLNSLYHMATPQPRQQPTKEQERLLDQDGVSAPLALLAGGVVPVVAPMNDIAEVEYPSRPTNLTTLSEEDADLLSSHVSVDELQDPDSLTPHEATTEANAEAAVAAAAVDAAEEEEAARQLMTELSVTSLGVSQLGSTAALRGRNVQYKSAIIADVGAKALEVLTCAENWESLIKSHVGPSYQLVGRQHMGQIRLLVFARMDIVPTITRVRAHYEATGIAGVGFNKGGVAVSLRVGETDLCFVNSHLAAHQTKLANRNADYSEIVRNIALGSYGGDLLTSHHHVVWMGDLNYRVDFGRQLHTGASSNTTDLESPTPEDHAAMCRKITDKQYRQLLELDQLTQERLAERAFLRFQEGSINFAPTFKVARDDAGFHYASLRLPAWCDRVLVRSNLPYPIALASILPANDGGNSTNGQPAAAAAATGAPLGAATTADAQPATFVREYFTAPAVTSSDHKPVAAVLALPLVKHTLADDRGHYAYDFVLDVWQLEYLEASGKVREHSSLVAAVAGPCLAQTTKADRQRSRMGRLQRLMTVESFRGRSHVLLKMSSSSGSSSSSSWQARTMSWGRSSTQTLELRRGKPENMMHDRLVIKVVCAKSGNLARGVLPLQPAAADYLKDRASATPMYVTLPMEKDGLPAGHLRFSLKLRARHDPEHSQTAHEMQLSALLLMKNMVAAKPGALNPAGVQPRQASP